MFWQETEHLLDLGTVLFEETAGIVTYLKSHHVLAILRHAHHKTCSSCESAMQL